jgi:predicted HTH domain antitoxin
MRAASALYNSDMLPANATLTIPQDVLDSARMTVADIRVEIALALYAQRRLSVGKAAQLAQMTLWQFRHALALRRITPNYEIEDLHQEMVIIRKWKS